MLHTFTGGARGWGALQGCTGEGWLLLEARRQGLVTTPSQRRLHTPLQRIRLRWLSLVSAAST